MQYTEFIHPEDAAALKALKAIPMLSTIINTNDKQRFEFSSDMQYIRARQGHSIHVDVELDECVPPSVLYH